MENGVITHRWSTKLRDENTVFQAELLALKEAIQYATYITSHQPVKILTNNKASIQARSNTKTQNATARQVFETLLEHLQIELQWIKAHAGYLGNVTAVDQLAKEAAESDLTPLITKLPKCHLQGTEPNTRFYLSSFEPNFVKLSSTKQVQGLHSSWSTLK
ncbi:hypothetical protein AVEN_36012-1 [Araneus ventricosus]|uniref:RNase H type-1 domain-containing protein n=1 Tax=Araneus ventricosus TaxID=182803 RepID=A0A4Y2KIZ1_ARAVE|nr:hypothetical protein AVEN_36012-1 [Araneus ventricosus]